MSTKPAPFAALVAVAVALGLGLSACGPGSGTHVAAPSPTSAAPVTPTPPSLAPSTTASPEPAPTAASPSPTPVGLAVGDEGPAVLALQNRLIQLGFWLSATDGSYGDTTQQAVLAFQKAKGLERDGVAGPQTMKALAAGVAITPGSTTGHVLEIDKTRQLLFIVNDGKIADILNTSTGSGQPYQQGGQTYIALTPSGQFTIFRQVDGDDPGPLGDLWRPKYFNGGIAIHGAADVPGYPASHGCARLSNAAIDWIWSADLAPIGTNVWVY